MDDKNKDRNSNKNTKNQAYKLSYPQKIKKRYFILWDVNTIVVNDKPITIKFPTEKLI
jgi:hypothetical protein